MKITGGVHGSDQAADRQIRSKARDVSAPRTGATLTEVLIALGVMSIGLVSVISMFPVSIARGLQASMLTKGTDLRYNAQSMIGLYPRMITDPDMTPANALTTEFFVVDPLGVYGVANDGARPDLASTYGNYNGKPLNMSITGTINTGGGINRYSFVPPNASAPDYLVTFPDTWVLVHEGTAFNPKPVGTTGYTQLYVTGLPSTTSGGPPFSVAGAVYRAIIYSSTDPTKSHTRRLTNAGADATGGFISWAEDYTDPADGTIDVDVNLNNVIDQNPLPGTAGSSPSFQPFKVRIETQERRYTWLLTGRKINSPLPGNPNAGQANVDLVVFFGRSFDQPLDDEALYVANLSAGLRYVKIDYSVYGKPPSAKRGGYIFDVMSARWYRITSSLPDPNSKTGLIVNIETPVFATTPNGVTAYVMFPKGVVDVYPLGNKP